jgi:hypothetical protein
MPRITTDADDMANRIGEALNDDVEAWSIDSAPGADPRTAFLRFTYDGRDWGCILVPLEKPEPRYEPEPDE